MLNLLTVEPAHRTSNHPMIEVSDRVPGERARLVVRGRSIEDNRPCTVIMIHEQAGTWVIHGLGNQGIRLPAPEIAELAEAILERTR